jgi:hypothetical protein
MIPGFWTLESNGKKVKWDFSLITYTGLLVGLEHLKIETRLIDKRLESVMGECVI